MSQDVDLVVQVQADADKAVSVVKNFYRTAQNIQTNARREQEAAQKQQIRVNQAQSKADIALAEYTEREKFKTAARTAKDKQRLNDLNVQGAKKVADEEIKAAKKSEAEQIKAAKTAEAEKAKVFKAAMRQIDQQIALEKRLTAAATAEYDKQVKASEKANDKIIRDLRRREAEINKANAQSAPPSNFAKAVYSSRFNLPGTNGNVMPLIGQVAKGGLGTMAGFATVSAAGSLTSAIDEAVKTTIKFDAAMANVNSIAQLSSEKLKQLRNDVVNLANDPAIAEGPTGLATALYDVYSSGFKGQEALEIVKVAAKGASAGLTDTATASRILMAVMNSGIGGVKSAGQAMDVLFQTVQDGVVTFPELASSLGAVLPTASKAGVSLQQVSAAIAIMTKSGQSGAEATNDLLNLITKIANPSDSASKKFRELGISFGFTGLQSRGLPGILAEIQEKTKGNADEIANLLPDMQAQRGVLMLLKQAGKEYSDEVGVMSHANDGAGATTRALTEQQKSFEWQLKQLKKEFEVIAVEVGPAFIEALRDALKAGKPLLDTIKDMAKAFHDLSPEVQQSYLKIGGIVALAATTIPAIFNIANAIMQMATAYRTVQAAAAAAAAAQAAANAAGGGGVAGAAGTAAKVGLLGRSFLTGGAATYAGAASAGFLGLTAAGAAVNGYMAYDIAQSNMKTSDAEGAMMGLPGWQQMRQESGDISDAIGKLRERQKFLAPRGRNAMPNFREWEITDPELIAALKMAGVTSRSSANDIEKAISGLNQRRTKLTQAANKALQGEKERRDAQSNAAAFDELSDILLGTGDSPQSVDDTGGAGGMGGGPIQPPPDPEKAKKGRKARAPRKPRKTTAQIAAEKAQKSAARYMAWRRDKVSAGFAADAQAYADGLDADYDDTMEAYQTVSKQYNTTGQNGQDVLPQLQERLQKLARAKALADGDAAVREYSQAGGGIKTDAKGNYVLGPDGKPFELNPEALAKLKARLEEINRELEKSQKAITKVGTERKEWLDRETVKAGQETAEARRDYEEDEFKKLIGSMGEFFKYGEGGKAGAEERARMYRDAVETGGDGLLKAARSGTQTDLQKAMDGFTGAKVYGDRSSVAKAELDALQQAMQMPGSKLGGKEASPLVLRWLKEMRSDADGAKDDALVMQIDGVIKQWQSGMRTSGQIFAENALDRLSDGAKNVLADVLSGKGGDLTEKFQNLGRDLLGGITGDIAGTMADQFNRSIKAKLAKAFLDGKTGFSDLFSSAEVSAARIAATGYSLLSAMMKVGQGGRSGTAGLIGGVLGGIAGSLIPGIGPLAGFGIGANLASGDFIGAASGLIGTQYFANQTGIAKLGKAGGTGSGYWATDAVNNVAKNGITFGPQGKSRSVGGNFQYIHIGDNNDRMDRQREEQDFIDQVNGTLSTM